MEKLLLISMIVFSISCTITPEVDMGLLDDFKTDNKYEDIRRAVIYSWEEVVDIISEDCYEESADIIMIQYENDKNLTDTNQYEIADVVWVRKPIDNQKSIKSAIQRWVEFFSTCEYGDTDISDNDELWYGVDSVARKALKRVNEYWDEDND